MRFEDRDFYPIEASRILNTTLEQVMILIYSNQIKYKKVKDRYIIKGKDINTHLSNVFRSVLLADDIPTVSLKEFINQDDYIEELTSVTDYENIDKLKRNIQDIAQVNNYQLDDEELYYILYKYYDVKNWNRKDTKEWKKQDY